MKKNVFTLIELLVSVTCQIGVLPLYLFKKTIRKMPYNACKASASYSPCECFMIFRKENRFIPYTVGISLRPVLANAVESMKITVEGISIVFREKQPLNA